jgi:hypothetical protein
MAKTNKDKQYYTAYLVTDMRGVNFINRPLYTGRDASAWGPIKDAHVFHDVKQARSCSNNINRRNDWDRSISKVVPVVMECESPRTPRTRS